MRDRRAFVAIVGGALLGLSPTLRVQGQAMARRIGFLSAFYRSQIGGFLSELRPELDKVGWADGRNIVLLEPRTAEGDKHACRPWQVNSSPRVPT